MKEIVQLQQHFRAIVSKFTSSGSELWLIFASDFLKARRSDRPRGRLHFLTPEVNLSKLLMRTQEAMPGIQLRQILSIEKTA